MAKNSTPSVAPALDRGLSILESLTETTEPLTLTQIAQRLELSVSEIQRVVNVLRERNYLVRDAQGAYRLSNKLYRIATAHPPYSDLAARATAPMQRFANETNESVHVGVLSVDELLIVASIEGRGLVRLTLKIGAVQAAESTASGRILLAYSPTEYVDAFADRMNLSRAKLSNLRRACEKIRKQGHEHSTSGMVEGIEDLSVPILTPGGDIIAALTATWLTLKSGKSKVNALLPPLLKAASEIARNYE